MPWHVRQQRVARAASLSHDSTVSPPQEAPALQSVAGRAGRLSSEEAPQPEGGAEMTTGEGRMENGEGRSGEAEKVGLESRRGGCRLSHISLVNSPRWFTHVSTGARSSLPSCSCRKSSSDSAARAPPMLRCAAAYCCSRMVREVPEAERVSRGLESAARRSSSLICVMLLSLSCERVCACGCDCRRVRGSRICRAMRRLLATSATHRGAHL